MICFYQMNGWTYERINKTDEWINEQEKQNEELDEWMNEWMNEW